MTDTPVVTQGTPLADSGFCAHVLRVWRNDLVVGWLSQRRAEPFICSRGLSVILAVVRHRGLDSHLPKADGNFFQKCYQRVVKIAPPREHLLLS